MSVICNVRTALAVLASGLAALLLALPSGAEAQPSRKPARIGILLFSSPDGDANVAALRQGLAELGYVEGKNLTTVYRYAGGKPERLAALAAELTALAPDVIFAMGGDVAPFARAATSRIPIIVAVSNDPVESGLAAALARPGGNLTGVTLVSSELAGKRLQILKEAAPGISRVAVLWNPDHVDPEYRETLAAGRRLGVRVQSLEVRRSGDFVPAFEAAAAERAQALIVISSRLMTFNQRRILEYAGRHRLPVVAGWGAWADEGALLSYGPDLNAIVRRAATHVDRVLKGANPGDLPIERPTTHELIINLRTAGALGLDIAPSLRGQASRVIE